MSIGDTTPLTDFYGNPDNRASFTMTPITGGYKIVLKVYPLANFDVAYQQETYYVQNGSWDFYTGEDFSTIGYENISIYYTDGSVGTQTIEEMYSVDLPAGSKDFTERAEGYKSFSQDVDGNTYDSFSVPANMIANSTEYLDTATGFDGPSNFAVKTSTTVGSNISSVEYYTEHGSVYSSLNIRSVTSWGSTMTYVSRFQEDLTDPANATYTYRSLGQKTGGWWSNTKVEERDSSVSGGIRSYTSSEKLWFAPLGSITPGSTPSRETIMDLVESATTPGNYSGTMETYWGNSGNEYSVELVRNVDGTTSMVTSYLSSLNRGIGDDMEIVLNNLDSNNGVSFVFPGSAARFDGTYEQGVLIGTYSIGNRSAEVEISKSGVAVNGTFYPNQELESPLN